MAICAVTTDGIIIAPPYMCRLSSFAVDALVRHVKLFGVAFDDGVISLPVDAQKGNIRFRHHFVSSNPGLSSSII